ncbi:transposase family protein [Desulfobacterium sp. N47]
MRCIRYHEWRHLNFFQHEAYLTARVPRVDCGDCGIKTVEVPWARSGSGFTLCLRHSL